MRGETRALERPRAYSGAWTAALRANARAAVACAPMRHTTSRMRDAALSPSTAQVIVHVWKDVTNVTEVLAGGYDVIRNVGYDKTSWCVPYTSTCYRTPSHAPHSMRAVAASAQHLSVSIAPLPTGPAQSTAPHNLTHQVPRQPRRDVGQGLRQ